MSGSPRRAALGLYAELLRTVRTFPSKKRAAIREDIRAEFREKARLVDPAAIALALDVGSRGLGTMRKYTRLDPRASTWSVDLEQAPMGGKRQ